MLEIPLVPSEHRHRCHARLTWCSSFQYAIIVIHRLLPGATRPKASHLYSFSSIPIPTGTPTHPTLLLFSIVAIVVAPLILISPTPPATPAATHRR